MPTKKKQPEVTDAPVAVVPAETVKHVEPKKKTVKKAPKKVKKASLKVEAQLDVKPVSEQTPEPVVKKKPITVKRIDDEKDDSVITVTPDPFTKKVRTKFVLKDGMVIVEPISNPFDE